jgi:vanillate O-demethylase monooxygenase subunit
MEEDMFVRNVWYIASWADELGEAPVARRICNEPIVLFRDKAGTAAAIADRCCHRATPLSLGEVVDGGLQCGYHGMVFDKTGACVLIPGQDHIPANARVPAYPVVERDNLIWVWIGEAEKADPSLVVDLSYHNDTAHWPHRHGTYDIAGNYLLMVDNLMDLTHLGYVHKKTIGGNPAAHVGAKMDVVRTQGGLKYTRWMLDSLPPPTYVAAYGFKGRVDRWQEFDFVAPSTIRQWTGAKDAGTGAPEGNTDGGFQFKVLHSITPETETTCRYYFATANGWAPENDEASDQFFTASAATFAEDKDVIEAQQKRLEEFGEDWLVPMVSDVARVQMRRIIDAMAGERRPVAAE